MQSCFMLGNPFQADQRLHDPVDLTINELTCSRSKRRLRGTKQRCSDRNRAYEIAQMMNGCIELIPSDHCTHLRGLEPHGFRADHQMHADVLGPVPYRKPMERMPVEPPVVPTSDPCREFAL